MTARNKDAVIEEIGIRAFDSPQALFAGILELFQYEQQSLVHYLNVHVANVAWKTPQLKAILQCATLLYCDGAGIVVASKWQGTPLPCRLTAADWFLDMLGAFAQAGKTVYLLGSEPGIAERAMKAINQAVPNHSVMGTHHGHILKNTELAQSVIAEINRLKPDILIVGMGTPLQEIWMDTHRHDLNVPVIYGIGAVMDYFAGKVSRCPAWMGRAGLEWLYRLSIEPVRLFHRYVIGNPQFLCRIALGILRQKLSGTSRRRTSAKND